MEETEALRRIRDLIIQEKDLACPINDDNFLFRFIRGKKYNVDAAFKSIQMYYRFRESFPEALSKLYPSALRKQFEASIYTILPNKGLNGQRVFLFKTRNWNLDEFSLKDIILGCYLITEEIISYKDGQENGIIAIADHGGITFSQMRRIAGQVTMKQIKQLIGFYQGAFPARFKGFHIVNHPRIFDMLFMLSRPFMSDKLKKRIHEHGHDLKKLHQFFSLDILPESLGGNISDDLCVCPEFMDQFFSKDDYYKDLAKYGYKKAD